jgi:hypothetical protein
MGAVTSITVGNLAEDYMFSQTLREYARVSGLDCFKLNSLNVVSHRNRTPTGRKAVDQLIRWKKQGNAIDEIFPEIKFDFKPQVVYAALAVRKRLSDIRNHGKPYIIQSVKDIPIIPDMIKLAVEKGKSDVLAGESSWTHGK